MLKELSQLKEFKADGKRVTVAVACGANEKVLLSLKRAAAEVSMNVLLCDSRESLTPFIPELGLHPERFSLEHCTDQLGACKAAVDAVRDGKADILMKGDVSTAVILREVLRKDAGLLTGSLLSHVALIQSPYYHKLLTVTDGAMNIAPSLKEKSQILENSVAFLHRLGLEKPKVAVIAAIEKVNEKMEATVDASELVRMSRKGMFPKCFVDGPLALDNAVSSEAAREKGIVSEVAGDADILLVPDIECGNVLYKALNFLGGAVSAGLLVGAGIPIILTSRADSEETRYYSILLAAALSGRN